MNILYINHYAGAPKYGMEYRPYYLSKKWVKSGHRVIIVASSYSHLRYKNPDVKKMISSEQIEGIEYMWLKSPKYKGNKIRRIINMVIFVFMLFLYSIYLKKKYKPDVVIASSTYPLDIFPAYMIKKAAKSKLIFEVHDLWPLTPIEIGKYSKYHPFIVLMQIAENFAYKKADYVVSILPKAYEHMKEHGLSYFKFIHIPNGINLDEWLIWNNQIPELHKNMIERLKIEKKFILGYVGSIGKANALDVLINSAKLLKEEKISIILIGDGPEKNKLMEKVKLYSLHNVFFLPPVSKLSIPIILNMMDALYIGLKKVPLFRYGISPNKLFDYMMSGKPIVQSISAGNDIVNDAKCGISVPAEDPVQVALAVKKLMAMSKEEREQMGINGRNYVLRNNTYEVLAKKFDNLFFDNLDKQNQVI